MMLIQYPTDNYIINFYMDITIFMIPKDIDNLPLFLSLILLFTIFLLNLILKQFLVFLNY